MVTKEGKCARHQRSDNTIKKRNSEKGKYVVRGLNAKSHSSSGRWDLIRVIRSKSSKEEIKDFAKVSFSKGKGNLRAI